MLKNKKAFTLAEVMVTLAVFGVLAALLLPAIANVRPNKNKVMFKKAYYVKSRLLYFYIYETILFCSIVFFMSITLWFEEPLHFSVGL